MKQTVLVVEDNAITRKVVRLALQVEGFHVVEAPDGKTALEQAAALCPALVVQDLRLPDIDGFELLAQLRALPGLAHIPIIAVTGNVPEQITGMARFTEVLMKPVEPSRLLRSIKAQLASRAPEPVVAALRPRILLAEDDLVQRKVVRLLLEHWGYDVTDAKSGPDGLRLARISPPDVIVSDLLMAGMDGLTFCREVRADAALKSIPFVLVTSYHLDEFDRELAASSGLTAIAAKSPDMAALRKVVDALTDEHGVALPNVPKARTRDFARMIVHARRESSAREQLDRAETTQRTLLPFLAQFTELRAQVASELPGDDEAIEQLLARYLDTAGAVFGCAFIATKNGLELRSRLGYGDAADADLPAFFGRMDVLERALALGVPVPLPSDGFDGPEIATLLARVGAESMFLIPLVVAGKRLAVLAVSADGPATSTQRLRIIDAVRGPIAQAFALEQTETALVMSREAFRAIVDSAPDGVFVCNEAGTITYANPAALEMFGYAGDELLGRAARGLVPYVDTSTGAPTGTTLRKDGTTFPSAVTITPFRDGHEHTLHAYRVKDLSQRETLERLAFLANRDVLTGLFNRRRFDEHMSERFVEAVRYKTRGTLLMLDLDGFKAINDHHGHQAGDFVLKAVANVLTTVTRKSDFVARLGGDEFVLELPHIDFDRALIVAEKLLVAIAVPIAWQGHVLQVGVSIGMARYPEDGGTVDLLVAAADAALYRSKRAGRNRVTSTEVPLLSA